MITSLISINKPFTDKIFSYEKGVEWRLKPLPNGTYGVYETKKHSGCGKVIGEIVIIGFRKFHNIENIPSHTLISGQLNSTELAKYAKGRTLYANVILKAVRYEKPKELGEFGITRPPQSWCRVKELICT